MSSCYHVVQDLIDGGTLAVGDGYRAKRVELADLGIPFARAGNIDGGFHFDGCELLGEPGVDKAGEKVSKPGDVVFTSKGTVGRFAFVTEQVRRFVYSPQLCFWRSTRPEVLDPRYLFFWMQSSGFLHQVAAVKGQTDMAEYVSLRDQRRMRIPPSPLPEQRRIAEILGALDDKIELNRKMNQTLEEMAQAIFKSWFIDFDGHTEFVDSELGRIPKGWNTRLLPDAMTFREGPGILARDFPDGGVPLLRLAGLKNGVSLLTGCNYLDPAKVEKTWGHFRLEKGDVLLSTSASLGRVAEVDEEAVGGIPYTGIIAFRPIMGVTERGYVRHYLASRVFQLEIEAMGVGSVLRHFGPTHLSRLRVHTPPTHVQKEFGGLVDPMNKAIRARILESSTLAELRDTLLPKLISGELRVRDAERAVEKAV